MSEGSNTQETSPHASGGDGADGGTGSAPPAETDALGSWRDLASLRMNVALLVTAGVSSLVLLREEMTYPGGTILYPVLWGTAFLALLLRLRERIPTELRSAAMVLACGALLGMSMLNYGFGTPNQFVIACMLVVLAAILVGTSFAWFTLAAFIGMSALVGVYFVRERPVVVGRTDVYDANNWARVILIFSVASGMAVWAVSLFSSWLTSATVRAEAALDALKKETRARVAHMDRERELEEELRRARVQGSLGTLSGGIARDFKELLTVVLQGATLIRDERDPEDRTAALDLVQNAGRRGADLADRLLEYSRGQNARQHWFSPSDAIADSLSLVQQLFPPNVELVFEHSERIGNLRAAPAHLDQLVLGLCTHARDRIPRGGSVRLRTSTLGNENGDDFVCISVLATGELTARRASDSGTLGSGVTESHSPAVSTSIDTLVQLMNGRIEVPLRERFEEEVVVLLPRGEPPPPIPFQRLTSG